MAETGITPAEAIDLVVTNVLSDPITLVLVLLGALFVGGASAVLGLLSLGAVAEQLGQLAPGGRSPPGPGERS
ncbi:hypothetical protein [Haloglomus litoreum]|uniref:hypothetical protein n=1 Tax=Haloglomus litoreum TaxID=3034026 RepID=UPI0023E82314|nr:hypothetical protein [Haloglomus sp. DT116]